MGQIISKEEFDELMRVKGETIGIAIREHKEFIFNKEGKEGLRKVEDAISSLGYPEYKKIKPRKFYPVGLYALTLIAAKRIFNWDDEEFEKMGRLNAKLSFILRILMRFLVSLDVAAGKVPLMWKRYYTVGNLRTMEYDKERRYVILRLEDFILHSLHCKLQKGYYSTILQIIVKNTVTCEETKCVHNGDEYHEFLLKW